MRIKWNSTRSRTSGSNIFYFRHISRRSKKLQRYKNVGIRSRICMQGITRWGFSRSFSVFFKVMNVAELPRNIHSLSMRDEFYNSFHTIATLCIKQCPLNWNLKRNWTIFSVVSRSFVYNNHNCIAEWFIVRKLLLLSVVSPVRNTLKLSIRERH